MIDTHSGRDECISALMDGMLDDDACNSTLVALTGDSQAASVWTAYHVIGDVLRSRELAPGQNDLEFLERFEKNLASSGLSLGGVLPNGLVDESEFSTSLGPSVSSDLQSANAAVFRWKLAASLASVAFVGVLGVGLWSRTTSDDNMKLASEPGPTIALPIVTSLGEQSQVMIRDAQLDALMAAHRELGGHSALQMPAGFLRNATYSGPGR
jgi:sigma-E factor negative regulatory protein RseA